jgi:ABC-type sugar transport system permease subunit
MWLTRRRLAPGELDHELIWLTVSLGGLACAVTWLFLGLPWPRCAFHDLTGLPCVTCGATRCAIQFFHGKFFAALSWNPLVFVSLCGLSIFDAYAFGVLVTRSPRLRIEFRTQIAGKYARTAVIGAFALNWIYLLSHWRRF